VTVAVENNVTELVPVTEYLHTYQISDIDQHISLLAIPFSVSLTNSVEFYDFACQETEFFTGSKTIANTKGDENLYMEVSDL
jgi:hypothetical protein